MPATREAPSPAPHDAARSKPYGKLRPGPGQPPTEVAAHQRARIHSAMVELAVERGYDGITVRELTRRAKISSRAFYQHFSGKEDCFLRTHELVVRRVAKRIISSQAGERDWLERLRLAFDAFARELGRERAAARFALVEAYAAGPAAFAQARRAECTFAGMIAEGFGRAPDRIVVPPLVVEGIVSGIVQVARRQVLEGNADELEYLGDRLMDWSLSNRCETAAVLSRRGSFSRVRHSVAESLLALSSNETAGAGVPTGDRALILSAITKLFPAENTNQLTVSRIRAAAGVSRRSFDSHFSSVDDCFRAALEQRVDGAFERAMRAQKGVRSWATGVHLAITALCDQLANDPALVRLCFANRSASPSGDMSCREYFVSATVDLICDSAPTEWYTDEFTAAASAGAIWGVIHQQVDCGRIRHLQRAAPTLSFLALAPAIGGSAAGEAICQEHHLQSGAPYPAFEP